MRAENRLVLLLSRISILSASILMALPATAVRAEKAPVTLTDRERERLRFKIDDLWSGIDLTVRNARSNRADLTRQEKEFRVLQIYNKIPIERGDGLSSADAERGFRLDLRKSAEAFRFKLNQLKVLSRSRPDKAIPATLPASQPSFRFTDRQLVTTYRIELTVEAAPDANLDTWIGSWSEIYDPVEVSKSGRPAPEGMPLYRLARNAAGKPIAPQKIGQNRWKLTVETYRFRDIRFPRLVAADPMQALPVWARQNPQLFAAREPAIWDRVETTRKLIPQATPLLQERGEFLLKAARMTFFTQILMN